MEFSVVEGLRAVKFDLVFTLALAAIFLFVGSSLQRRVGVLARASIPAAAIGGLLFALLVLALRSSQTLGVTLDNSLRAPLQTAFFTTIGLSATLALLRGGGWRMIFFLLLASLTAVMQNVAGIGMARLLRVPDALGIICGALTLTGGPATGLGFQKLLEQEGIAGAGELIIAAATFGIFVSSLVGNPVASLLIRRFRLSKPQAERAKEHSGADELWAIGSTGPIATLEDESVETVELRVEKAELTGGEMLRHLLLILIVMGVGAVLSFGLTRLGLTFPGYVGAMVVAALVRNFDDRLKWFGINMRAVDALGVIALSLFLVIALMDLKLWQLAGLALPMLLILAVQVVLMILYAVFLTFVLMGRDYEAAVTAGGHIGFGLGITPNAVANMEALVARFGPAPRSFLYVPIVGAFFIDFTNVLIITAFLNFV